MRQRHQHRKRHVGREEVDSASQRHLQRPRRRQRNEEGRRQEGNRLRAQLETGSPEDVLTSRGPRRLQAGVRLQCASSQRRVEEGGFGHQGSRSRQPVGRKPRGRAATQKPHETAAGRPR